MNEKNSNKCNRNERFARLLDDLAEKMRNSSQLYEAYEIIEEVENAIKKRENQGYHRP